MTHKLIGYDARITGDIPKKLWPKSRRDRCLLNPSVEYPCSCDSIAWPSIFRFYNDIRLPDLYHDNSSFWSNYRSLLTHINISKLFDRAYSFDIISITYDGDESIDRLGNYFVNVIDNFIPNNNEYEWEFLGYEATDCGFQSANAGMGHIDFVNKIPVFRPERMKYSKYINKYNLFDSYEIAEQFCFFEDDRVPEHLPFFAFSLWRLKVTNQIKDQIKKMVDLD